MCQLNQTYDDDDRLGLVSFLLILVSTILLIVLQNRKRRGCHSTSPKATTTTAVETPSTKIHNDVKRIPGPPGLDHSKELAAAGSLTAYVSSIHKQYESPIVQFYRSPGNIAIVLLLLIVCSSSNNTQKSTNEGDLVVSCYDVELLNTTLRGMGTRPPGLFEFLTRMLGDDNLQIYRFPEAKNLRSLIRPGLDHSFIKAQFDDTINQVFDDHLLQLKKRCQEQEAG